MYDDTYKITLKIFRCLYRWCLPLPIPNREVKRTRADGTAVTRGRVGRCQILKQPCSIKLQGFLVYKPFLNYCLCQLLFFSNFSVNINTVVYIVYNPCVYRIKL